MKRLLLAVGVLLTPVLLVAADDPAKKEYQKFTGSWRFASVEIEGKELPLKLFKSSQLILDGDKFTYKEGSQVYKGTYKVDVKKKPKHIDMTFTEGPEKGKTSVGIYELDGDTYKVCVAIKGKDRPTAFVSKPGSGHVLEVLTREKATEDNEAIKKEMAKLEGTWQLQSAETDGKKLADEQVKQIRVVIETGKHTVFFGDKVVAEGIAFRVDPTKSPKEVEDTLKDGKVIRGIYELDGDTLKSCVAPVDNERPTELTGKKGSGYTLRIFRRVKP